MVEQMTYEKATGIAKEALERYRKAQTKAEIEQIFLRYGRKGIGYRPLCRMFFAGNTPEKAIRAYKRIDIEELLRQLGLNE